jgi:osmotically-inducible protein OsmY
MNGTRRMRFLVAVGLGLGALVPSLASPRSAAAETETAVVPAGVEVVINDEGIVAAIKAKLEQKKMLKTAQITVSSVNGYVTLVGLVNNVFARDEAIEAARSTPGVLRIDDQLRLDIASPAAPTRN